LDDAQVKPMLKTHTKAFALLALIAAIAIAAHLFKPTTWPPLGSNTLHSMHGPGFAIIALLVLWYYQNQSQSNINYILAATIAMGIGLISEIAQIPGTRNAEAKDLVVDALGIFGALGIAASFDKKARQALPKWAKIALPATACLALAGVSTSALWKGHALIRQQLAFPTLLTFENRWESATIDSTRRRRPTLVAAPSTWPKDGSIVARAKESGRWGLFLTLQPQPDWSGYGSLSFLAASAGEEFLMSACVSDSRPNRTSRGNFYCKRMQVGPAPQEYSIAFSEIKSGTKSQKFDFSQVQAVFFSAAEPGNDNELLIDDIRLEL
jgi:hypothetical protein